APIPGTAVIASRSSTATLGAAEAMARLATSSAPPSKGSTPRNSWAGARATIENGGCGSNGGTAAGGGGAMAADVAVALAGGGGAGNGGGGGGGDAHAAIAESASAAA